eukprot:4359475-Pleurochrysis_carterae.AAC.4
MQHQAPPRKLASQNAVFKKAFARGCADRLRAIEGRLDKGCGRCPSCNFPCPPPLSTPASFCERQAIMP